MRTIIALLDKKGENVVPKLIASIGKETNNKTIHVAFCICNISFANESVEKVLFKKIAFLYCPATEISNVFTSLTKVVCKSIIRVRLIPSCKPGSIPMDLDQVMHHAV